MAEVTLNTKIKLRYDTYANWLSKNPILKTGEAAVATVPTGDTNGVSTSLPAVVIKIGDGTHHYDELQFLSARSADVYAWAKAATKPTYDASEITGLSEYISGEIQDTDTQYQIVKVDDYNYKLQSKALKATAWTDVSTFTIPNHDDKILADAKAYADGLAGAESTLAATVNKLNTTITKKESVWDKKQNAITDGSATIASVDDNVVTLKAGVKQTGGAVGQGTGADIVLAKVAKTGAATDISIADADDKITATTVEGALAEIATKLASAVSGGNVTCEKSAPDGVAARYTFKQGGVAIENAVIDIPKDMVVQSGSVVKNPAGQKAGTYIELVLANATNDKIYVNVGDLIEYVTSGSGSNDMVKITVSNDHKVTADITDGSITLAKLASAVQTQINKAHEHTNKAELDKIATGDKAKWDGAAAKAHEHANKAVIDGIAAEDVTKWNAADAAIAGAVQASTIDVDNTSIELSSDNKLAVKQVNVNKLFIASGDTLIFDCGNASS